MDITIFIFDDVTALDAVGPYEALRRLPNVQIIFAALERGPISTGGGLVLHANVAIHEIQKTDLLIIPGGAVQKLMANAVFLEWLRRMHDVTQWTTSVCTGALLLGAAGLLRDLSVSTHWRVKAVITKFGATYSENRITESGRIITAAGVSAAIDLGIHLCSLIAGTEMAKAVQLSMEYRPQPPFSIGTAEQEPALVELVNNRLHS